MVDDVVFIDLILFDFVFVWEFIYWMGVDEILVGVFVWNVVWGEYYFDCVYEVAGCVVFDVSMDVFYVILEGECGFCYLIIIIVMVENGFVIEYCDYMGFNDMVLILDVEIN